MDICLEEKIKINYIIKSYLEPKSQIYGEIHVSGSFLLGGIMNIKGTMKKLQTAILQTGLPITISNNQFYSPDQNRFVPIIILSTKIYSLGRDGEWKDKNYEILRTSSKIDALMCLVEIYKAVSEKE